MSKTITTLIYCSFFGFIFSCNETVLVNQSAPTDTSGKNTDTITVTSTDTATFMDTQSTSNQSSYFCNDEDTSILMCNTFEDLTIGELQIVSGALCLDSTSPYAGDFSLKTIAKQEYGFAYLIHPFDSIESGTVYFKAYVYIPKEKLTGQITVLNLSGQNNPNTNGDGIDINISADLSLNIYQHGNLTRFTSSINVIPTDEWFCLRGSYVISKTAGATSVWINDNLVASTLASSESIINNGVSEIKTGIVWTEGGQVESEVYIDNLIVSTKEFSCSSHTN